MPQVLFILDYLTNFILHVSLHKLPIDGNFRKLALHAHLTIGTSQ